MENYTYQNTLIGKKQLREILGWSFTNYNSMQACILADELKYLGFKYASQAGISISIEDLKVPFIKNLMIEKANQEIIDSEKVYLKGKLTEVERFQKIIDTWSLTSESLKDQVIYYFTNYDPLNSVYIMACSGARGNLSQVRQLVGMRGLMSDPSGQIMNLPIKKNFREGLTITDYLMSGYGARKGIVDTALKTANSGYLTRRLIDVAQDIVIREHDCLTTDSFLVSIDKNSDLNQNQIISKMVGRILNKPIFDPVSNLLIAKLNTQILPSLIKLLYQKNITQFYIRSPFVCQLYRAICQKCYGWDLANENLIDIGEAVGILAGQSIGEPGTQLTMRTFHTGGIFTSEARQQIISPTTGLIQFSKFLKTVILRTNRGENVLVTKNSGLLILIPEDQREQLIKIKIVNNTILFPKNNQYVQKDSVIGELINTKKQIKQEIKPILSYNSGEIIVPRLKSPPNFLNNNKLLWLLSGQLYNSPINSFINFYSDYKLKKFSFIFRTKVLNHYSGFVKVRNKQENFEQQNIQIKNTFFSLKDGKIQFDYSYYNQIFLYFLNYKKLTYFLPGITNYSQFLIQNPSKNPFGKLIKNSFRTLTGGKLFYDYLSLKYFTNLEKTISYYDIVFDVERLDFELEPPDFLALDEFDWKEYWAHHQIDLSLENIGSSLSDFDLSLKNIGSSLSDFILSLIDNGLELDALELPVFNYRTLTWLPEETQKVNCEESLLLVQDGDYISENFEIIPGKFSKTSGVVILKKRNNIVQTITIKTGGVYKGEEFSQDSQNFFYPGEQIFTNLTVVAPCLCEMNLNNSSDQILIRPIQLYEFPQTQTIKQIFGKNKRLQKFLNLVPKSSLLYKSNQKVNTANQAVLGIEVLNMNISNQSLNIQLENYKDQNSVNFKITEKLSLNYYITPKLKYKNLKPCLLIQKSQFLDSYTISSFLEDLTNVSLEIVKFKINQSDIKQILLISNQHCITVQKKTLKNKKLNDFVLNSNNVNEIGKIIVENKEFMTIQKGRPYFFPNCRVETSSNQNNLEYKVFPFNHNSLHVKTDKTIFLNSYDILKIEVKEKSKISLNYLGKMNQKSKFSKLFMKKNGKLYSCLIPRFFKKFTIKTNASNTQLPNVFTSSKNFSKKFRPISRTLLLESSDIIVNNLKTKSKPQFTFVKFLEYPFPKSTKSIGLYSITEDYFEQEVNSVFCNNYQFIENGYTIGLINIEKEITGDIVQGLPRIEEILEARKKTLSIKRIPTSQKKSLLVQKTGLDPNFDFRKIGTEIKDNEKVNPHKLLKAYFNYYGLVKRFYNEQTELTSTARLISNFEGTYKSFKKVQSFILNSVQSVYQSQGVTINDKHLEIIIKQMTTKVLITYEGNTPLLRKEVIDLYHINYINKIMDIQNKDSAYYVPLLLGITKASLNNPSFISAASFQETTRVLTKAAIEGRIDWLRGLKENIIIGHLIPAGTGYRSYQKSFKNLVSN